MATVDRLVDGLALHLTGGATNTSPDASLGGAASTTRVRGLGAIISTPIPGVRLDNVFPACGVGEAILSVDLSGNLVFVPPGATPGSSVAVAAGASVIVSGSEVNKAIRVAREVGYPWVPQVSTVKLVEVLEGVLAQARVANAQRVTGLTTYRAVMLRASTVNGIANLRLWLPPIDGAQAVYSIGVEDPDSSGNIQTIPDETTAPTGVTWYTPTSESGAVVVATIAYGASVGLWIRRVFPAAGDMTRQENMELEMAYLEDVSSSPEFTQTYKQGFRVEDTTIDEYELYVGEGSPPDFAASGQPVATSATLPFSWTPSLPSSGNATFCIVVRKLDRYGLQSFNVFSTVKVFESHAEVLPPLSAPRDVQVYDDAPEYIRIVSKYVSSDDPYPADVWQLYVKIGSDPDINSSSDLAYEGDMAFVGAESGIAQVVGPHTAGTVAHVIAVVKRTIDGARKAAPVVLHTLAASLDLSEGFMFGGNTFEQR